MRYVMKDGIAEPEETVAPRERLSKHAPMIAYTNATMEKRKKRFPEQSVQRLYEARWSLEPSARGYNWITLFLGDINTGTWLSRLEESQMRQ
jgi:hypothetical protein